LSNAFWSISAQRKGFLNLPLCVFAVKVALLCQNLETVENLDLDNGKADSQKGMFPFRRVVEI
jgi:hypothetical protein